MTMETTQTPSKLHDPRRSPAEVSEEFLHRQQPPVDPRTQPSVTGAILHLLREVSSLRSEMTMLKASISQIYEFRFPSLEDKACETQQTASIMLASQSDPRALPGASTSSFSSHQSISDAAQTAVSPSSAAEHAAVASTEPAAPSASEPFRAAPSTLVYVETEEKALQVLADAWSQERTSESETAHAQAGQPENTFTAAPPPIAPEYKPEPEPVTSTKEITLPMIAAVWTQKWFSESETAHTVAEECDQQEGSFSGAPPLIAPEPQPLISTEEDEEEIQMSPAVLSQERISESEVAHVKAEECDQQEGSFSGAPPLIAPEPQPLISTEEKGTQMSPAVLSQERISESEVAHVKAEESDQQEGSFSGAPPLIVPIYQPEPQTLTSTEEKAEQIFAAVSSQDRISESKTAHTEAEVFGPKEDIFSGALPLKYKPDPQPWTNSLPELPQPTTSDVMQKEAPPRATQLSRRLSTSKRPSSTALTSTTTSAGSHSHLVSSPPTEVMPPIKCQRKSIAWQYFRKKSKYIATCNDCGVDLKTGNKDGRAYFGTGPLLSHLKRIHHIFLKKKADSQFLTNSLLETPELPQPTTLAVMQKEAPLRATQLSRRLSTNKRSSGSALTCGTTSTRTLRRIASSPSTKKRPPTKRRRTSFVWPHFIKKNRFVATCKFCKEDVNIGKKGGCGRLGTATLLSHLKRKHNVVK